MVAPNPHAFLLLLEFQGLGPGWSALNELLAVVSKLDAHSPHTELETAYPAAENSFLAFFTGPQNHLIQLVDYIKKSQWNSYLVSQTLVENGLTLINVIHHLKTPQEVRSLLIVESLSVQGLLKFAARLPSEDIFEIHLRKSGPRGGWIYSKLSPAAEQAAESTSKDIKVTLIPKLDSKLEPFF